MANQRDIRRLAMQVMYQIDMRGQVDDDAIASMMDGGPDTPDVQHEAEALARAAWGRRAAADAAIAELTPDWPTHRQPPVDRAILRLAYHEIVTGRTPAKVAINEAVELAKQFCAQPSAPFINGVLDKLAKRIDAPAPVAKPNADAWLDDAIDQG